MVIIWHMRMIVFTIVFFGSLSFDIHAAQRDQWRVQADTYVASLSPVAQKPVKEIMAALHDAQTRADIALCAKQIERLNHDADTHCHALSVKAVSALYEYFKHTLLLMVHAIDAQIAFLEYRKTNPSAMLLYRSPLTWGATKNNMELQNDSNALHARREHYLQILGNSIIAVESFPRPASSHEIAAWVSRVTEIILGKPTDSLASREQLVAMLKRALDVIENERKTTEVLTADATTSNRIEKGINYVQRAAVFGAIALLSGGGFLVGCVMTEDAEEVIANHKIKFKEKLKEVTNELDAKLEQPVLQQEAFQPEEPVRVESSTSSGDAKSERSPSTSSRADTESELAEDRKSVLFGKVRNKIKNMVAGSKGEATSSDKDKGKEDSKTRPPSPKLGLTDRFAAGTGKNVAEGVLQNPEINAGVKNFNKVLEMIQEKLGGVTFAAIAEGMETVGSTIESLVDNKLKSKTGLAISGSSLVAGIAATAWYIKRIASKNGKVYTAMKQGMLDIEDILSCYDQPNQTITAHHLGQLAYIGSQLNEYASAVLSYAESQLLASDVAQLQSPSISIANKSKKVQRMYSTYSFLVPSRAIII